MSHINLYECIPLINIPASTKIKNSRDCIVVDKRDNLEKCNDKFYKDGILGKIISDTNEINYLFCNKDWVIGLYFAHTYYSLIKNIDINILICNNSNNGFISGIYHYIYHSSISKLSNTTPTDVKWYSIDKKNNTKHKNYNRLVTYLDSQNKNISDHVIHGYTNDEINLQNINLLRTYVYNHMNSLSIYYANISKSTDDLLHIYLAIDLLHNNGIFITKIPNPEHWDKHQLLLIALIFQSVSIHRLPVCKNKTVYMEYYCISHRKKKITYYDIIKSNLLFSYKNNIQMNLDSMMNLPSVIEWYENLQLIQQTFITDALNISAYDELNNLINKFKDII